MKHTSAYFAVVTNNNESPQQLYQQPLHHACVTAWCGVTNFVVTGPYFFEDENGHVVTVTSVCYVEMLWNFLTPEVSRELSSRPYGFSSIVQLLIQRENP
jgi:hypothetical protein